MALQQLRSSTANKRPTAGAMSDGQLAVNTNATNPGLFFKDADGSVRKIGPVFIGSAAPNASPASGGSTGHSVGEQWLDNSGGTYVLKIWDGTAWRSESGTFVDVNGDNMTGNLTLGTDKVVLNATSGAGTFDGAVAVQGASITNDSLGVYLNNGNVSSWAGASANIFTGFTAGSSTPTSTINGGGSATLGSGNISLNSNGSATFAGTVESTNTSFGFKSNSTIGNSGKHFYADEQGNASASNYFFYGENSAGEAFRLQRRLICL